MLRLSLPEWACWDDLGDDATGPEPRSVDIGDRVLGDLALLVVKIEDRRAVTRPDIATLTIPRRRVVYLEEQLEQLPVGDLRRIKDDLDRLGVAAMVTVGRIRDVASGVADS